MLIFHGKFQRMLETKKNAKSFFKQKDVLYFQLTRFTLVTEVSSNKTFKI